MQKWDLLLPRIFVSSSFNLLLKRWVPVNEAREAQTETLTAVHCCEWSACVTSEHASPPPPPFFFISHVHPQTHTSTCIQDHFNPSPAQCFPSLLALCDDVTFFPSFKVDTGVFIPQPDTPDTPVSPYLSSPDEVTACGGVVGDAGVIKPRLATVSCYLPRPLLSHLSAVANLPPLTRTFCRQHVTHSLHLTSPCTFKWQQSAPTLLIFDVNRHGVNWKISGWFWLFTENHQTRTPTFPVNDDLKLIINFPMPLH